MIPASPSETPYDSRRRFAAPVDNRPGCPQVPPRLVRRPGEGARLLRCRMAEEERDGLYPDRV